MFGRSLKSLFAIALLVGVGTTANAQDTDAGKAAYMSSCAACHGADAKGDGILSSVLKVPPADLTTLARRNNGEFPITAVSEIIDGRTLIAAHGSREMPIWGFDAMVRSRIALIVDYLNRIQVK
jgi:mono/diheme cytochrome c family protein